jgi:hypothetical protein
MWYVKDIEVNLLLLHKNPNTNHTNILTNKNKIQPIES